MIEEVIEMARIGLRYAIGRVVELIWFNSADTSQKHKTEKKSSISALIKSEQNIMSTFRYLARVLNSNFSARDYFIVLTYVPEDIPETWEKHERDRILFIDRLNYALEKNGEANAKWVALCSNIDGQTGEIVERHIHVILNGEPFTFKDGRLFLDDTSLDEIWGHGLVKVRPLYGEPDFTALARYLIKQARRVTYVQKFHSSRNLIRPMPEVGSVESPVFSVPAGAVVVESCFNPRLGYMYKRVILPEDSK